jgi:hypothetical protein
MGILRQRKRNKEHENLLREEAFNVLNSTKAELSSILCNERDIENIPLSIEQQKKLDLLTKSLNLFNKEEIY